MALIQTLSMDFALRGIPQKVVGKQDDSGGLRQVKILLYNNGVPYSLASGTGFMIRYKTAQGAIGLYDTMPDGTSAFEFTEGSQAVTASLVDQIFAQPGNVECELRIIEPSGSVSTWTWIVEVEKSNVGDATIPSDYINVIAGYAAAAAQSAVEAKTAAAAVPNLVEYDLTITPMSSEFSITVNRGTVAYWGEWCFISYSFFVHRTDWIFFADFSFKLSVPIPDGYQAPSSYDVSGTLAATFSIYTALCQSGGNGLYAIDASPLVDATASSIDVSFSTCFRVGKKS